MEVPDGIVTGLGGAGGSAAAAGGSPGAGAVAAAGFGVGEFATVWLEGTPVWSEPGTLAGVSGGAGFSFAPMGDEGGAETE